VDEADLMRRSAELAERDEWGAEALAVNRELVARHLDAEGARFRLALCFERAGDLAAARDSFACVLERRDRGREARVARRRVAVLDERVRAAKARSVHKALALGRKLVRAGDLDRAHVWYVRAEELARTANERAQALTGQASVLRTERTFADALRTAERAVAVQPSHEKNVAAYAIMIALLADLGRLTEAKAEADALLADRPRNRIACATAGRVYIALFARTRDHAYRRHANRLFAEARRGR
jgi:tetratricopeptide (TPR) repeat protein